MQIIIHTSPHLTHILFAVVPDEALEPPEDRLPDPQDTMAASMADVPSYQHCIDSAPTEHSASHCER